MAYKELTPEQKITTSFYCKWSSGAKSYFHTLEEAIKKADEMYIRKPTMTDENYKYWLEQKQYIGVETTIETPIKIVFAPVSKLV